MPSVLAVDNEDDNVELLRQVLEEAQFEVFAAHSGQEAIALAVQHLPDVILLDIHMPGMDGYEVCRTLKAQEITRQIPVIFLTANTTEESIVKGLEIGAYDYITKPFNEKELVARIKVMLRIRATEQRTENMALTDSLTGLYNRRFLVQRFDEEKARLSRNNEALACLMFDIDFFKKINDTYGHECGDVVLKRVAKVLRDNVRGYDALVRHGGEEFVVLLPATNVVNARIVAGKLRSAIEQTEISCGKTTLKATVSVGVYGVDNASDIKDLETFIKYADEALYQAKKAGRNRVCVYGQA